MDVKKLLEAKEFVRKTAVETTGNFQVLTVYAHFTKTKLGKVLHGLDKGAKESEQAELYKTALEYFENQKAEHSKTCIAAFYKPDTEVVSRILELPFETEWKTELFLDTEPYLERLLALLERDNPYIVVMATSNDARVQVWTYKNVLEDKRIRAKIHGKHKAGGQSAARFERLIKGHIREHFLKVIEQIRVKWGEYKPSYLVLTGPGDAKHELEKLLPQNIKDKVAGKIDTMMDLNGSESEIFEKVRKAREEFDKSIVNTLIAQAGKGGKAKLGLEDIKKAASMGEVDTLYIEENYNHDRSTIEHLVDEIEEFGGKVEFLNAKGLLDRYEGVCASLRFST